MVQIEELALLSYVQRQVFPTDYQCLKEGRSVLKKSKLYNIRPVMIDGVIRVSGRLELKPLTLESRHQIILPGDHVVTRRIVEDIDNKLRHTSGREYVLSRSRERYWILNGRRLVRRILKGCFHCRRIRARTSTQLMANLPESRLASFEPPFTSTGLDYFGPFNVKIKRSHVKRWGCIFTCMTSRAIHIEVAESLDASAFINALRRFIARRGKPAKIQSDNGSNFVAGNRELKQALDTWNKVAEERLKQDK